MQKFSSDQIKTKCFVGTEAEGPNRGARVLFVPGCVRAQGFLAAYQRTDPKPQRIYYGAGHHRDLLLGTLAAIRRIVPNCAIDLEVESLDCIDIHLVGGSITIITMDPRDRERALQEKFLFHKEFTDDLIRWTGKAGVYETRRDDPLFLEDRDI